MHKNKSYVLSPECLEEARNLELQELCLRRATACKRMAGASNDATTEEIGSCSAEADRNAMEISEEEKNPRSACEGTCQRRQQDVRRWRGRIGRSSVVVKVRAWAVLECGGTVRELDGPILDAAFDAYVVRYPAAARIFQEIGWSGCWCTRAVHSERFFWETEMPSSHHTPPMERTSERCWRSEQMGCSRAGWTVDCQFCPSASQRQTVGRVRDCPAGDSS